MDSKKLGIGGSGPLGGESMMSNNKTGPKAAAAAIASMGIPSASVQAGPEVGMGKKG